MNMDSCVFCEIRDGQSPAHIIWEDDNFMAFLDAHPFNSGHTLLIAKKHIDYVFDLDDDSPAAKFISGATLVLLQELLNKLSAGNIDPDFLAKQAETNPVISTCEIRLFLQRQRDGQFDVTFDNGQVIGSRSAEVVVNYLPPVPF